MKTAIIIWITFFCTCLARGQTEIPCTLAKEGAVKVLPGQRDTQSYRDEAGELMLILDHNTHRVLYRKEDHAVGYVRRGDRWHPASIRHLPSFAGSPVEMDARIANVLSYPQAAYDVQVSGEVVVSAVITARGAMTDISIEQDIGYGCGEVVASALKQFPSDWIPADAGHGFISSKVYFSVMFTLDPLPDFVSPGHTPVHATGMGQVNQQPALNYFRSYTVNRAPEVKAELLRT